jgi:hypothetical protein
METKDSITTFTRPALSQFNPVQAFPPPFHPTICVSLQNGLFPSENPNRNMYAFLFLPRCATFSHPSRYTRFVHSNNI